MTQPPKVLNTGLGLRREILDDFRNHPLPTSIDFLEIAPENWMRMGGYRKEVFQSLTQHYPFFCHGLSLSLGSPAPLDEEFLKEIKLFLDTYHISVYSEHLSFCSDTKGMLLDLLPMPFTEEAVHYLADRIQRTQDILERRIAVENISYYTTLAQDLSELEFTNAVLDTAGCDLLLDINNIYVNSQNHHYDPEKFLLGIHPEKIRYFHIAGHENTGKKIVDTHGEPVIEPVWDLLKTAYKTIGLKPTLLERDNNVPELAELLVEIDRLNHIQREFSA
ncbi:MAG TPA: DUF692 domain-containing protein [Gammaproteobacteria bacterium]|nr:DUF692 domain-containing protein [Gammaproteobacteria bacterium]